MQNNSPLSTLIHSQARKYGNRTAMKYKDYVENKWKDISWNTFSETVRLVSNAMMELGIGIQENMAVFSQNMPECMYVDFGAYALEYMKAGAAAVGGCCTTDAGHIRRVAEMRDIYVASGASPLSYKGIK